MGFSVQSPESFGSNKGGCGTVVVFVLGTTLFVIPPVCLVACSTTRSYGWEYCKYLWKEGDQYPLHRVLFYVSLLTLTNTPRNNSNSAPLPQHPQTFSTSSYLQSTHIHSYLHLKTHYLCLSILFDVPHILEMQLHPAIMQCRILLDLAPQTWWSLWEIMLLPNSCLASLSHQKSHIFIGYAIIMS